MRAKTYRDVICRYRLAENTFPHCRKNVNYVTMWRGVATHKQRATLHQSASSERLHARHTHGCSDIDMARDAHVTRLPARNP